VAGNRKNTFESSGKSSKHKHRARRERQGPGVEAGRSRKKKSPESARVRPAVRRDTTSGLIIARGGAARMQELKRVKHRRFASTSFERTQFTRKGLQNLQTATWRQEFLIPPVQNQPPSANRTRKQEMDAHIPKGAQRRLRENYQSSRRGAHGPKTQNQDTPALPPEKIRRQAEPGQVRSESGSGAGSR